MQPRYWVAEEEVNNRIPCGEYVEQLKKAVKKCDTVQIRFILHAWCAGHYFNCGDDERATEFVERITGAPDAHRSLDIDEFRTTATANELADTLTDDDIRLIESGQDAIAIAASLIECHVPTWLMGFRDIARSTDERTVISSIIPKVGVGHTLPLFFLNTIQKPIRPILVAQCSSFCVDYVTRQKIGGTHLTYGYFSQIPVLPPSVFEEKCLWASASGAAGISIRDWLLPRAMELLYTSADMEPFARECGYAQPPFGWVDDRRFAIRCELDAAFFHLYGIARNDVEYIMDTFPIVRRKDEDRYGTYRTKETILGFYDTLADAMRSGVAFVSGLFPPHGTKETSE